MKILKLERKLFFDNFGTFGELTVDGWKCFTVEKQWIDNKPFYSRIPNGVYIIKRGNFKGEYENFELQDVDGRSAIEFHVANFQKELKGCIGVGDSISWFPVYKLFGVTNSKITLMTLMERMYGVDTAVLHIFTIKDAFS